MILYAKVAGNDADDGTTYELVKIGGVENLLSARKII